MYAVVVEVILPKNIINHRKILSLNTLTDEKGEKRRWKLTVQCWFYCSKLSPHKKPHNENPSFSGNIYVKAELLGKRGSKMQ